MAYFTAWVVYLAMAILMMLIYERYAAPLIAARPLRVSLRAVMAIGLFTPGAVTTGGGYMVPASIGVVYQLLARSGTGMLKAALPLLLATAVVFAALFLYELLRKEQPAE